jgi:hypothetical protein
METYLTLFISCTAALGCIALGCAMLVLQPTARAQTNPLQALKAH